MYAAEYGTDWERLDEREVYRRAFALGIAESLGEEHPGELARLLDQVQSAYDEGIVELAYEEGRNRASKRAAEPEEDEETIWESEVDEWVDEMVEVRVPDSLPPAVERLTMLDRHEDRLERIRLPSLLLRR